MRGASRWRPRRSSPTACSTCSTVAGSGSGGPASTSTRSTARPSRDRRRSTGTPPAAAVDAAVRQHADWGKVELDERKERVTAAVDVMAAHRDLLALLLVWEIGKPWRLACADVDRGARRCPLVRRADRPAARRRAATPLPGPVSNIASWNYPMSVQVHAELVQALAGNAVVAKTPTQGGFALPDRWRTRSWRRAGLPVTLLSGGGASSSTRWSAAPEIGALAFVGGRSNGGPVATALARHRQARTSSSRRASTPGASGTSPTGTARRRTSARASSTPSSAAPPTRALSCSATWSTRSWPMYLPVRHVPAVRPPARRRPTRGDPLPELDFGPVISAPRPRNSRPGRRGAAGARSALPRHARPRSVHRRAGHRGYVAPAALLAPPARRR